MALPGAGKDFGTFQQEDMMCRQFAYEQNGGAAGAQAATNNAVGTAILGTAVGAGLGMALGSLGGAAGTGAAIGGTMGALMGSSAAASGAARAGGDLQQGYDTAYTQCMYSRGNSIQSPPGGYRSGISGPEYGDGYGGGYGYEGGYGYGGGYGYEGGYGYGPGPVGYYAGPSVFVGTGWGWGGRHSRWR